MTLLKEDVISKRKLQ